MKRILLLSALFVFAIVFGAFAQRTVSGKVTDDSGEDLPGVNVVVKGTTTGTTTDLDGNYRLSVDDGTTLVFSFIGFAEQEVEVGVRTVIDVTLGLDVTELQEVVVTAQGIQRRKEALGFAVSNVGKDAVAEKTEGDVVRSLRSKASGVQVTQQSGMSGSGTSIIIRGYTSVTGDNQPLFIIDGVPFNTNTNSSEADGSNASDFIDGGNNGSSRFLDLDPNNIEDISILKGLAASTLYGSQGRNGVVLITTKSGFSSGSAGKKLDISVSQSLFVNEIASLPDYQNSYGNGFDQVFGWFFSNWGPSFSKTGLAGWGADNSIDQDGNLPHPYSQYSNPDLRAVFPEFQRSDTDADAVTKTNAPAIMRAGAPYPWRPYDNVKDFFRKGTVKNTSINARGRSDDGKTAYNVNLGYLNDQGFTPGNGLDRLSFSVGGRSQLSNNFTVNATMNLSRTEYIAPPVSASEGNGAYAPGGRGTTQPVSSSIFGHLFFTPRSIDLNNLPSQHPVTGASVYYRNGNDIQNPVWTLHNTFLSQLTNRVFGTTGLAYEINDNLNIAYRLGYDIYNERNESGQNKGGLDGPVTGQFRTFDNLSTIWDNTLNVNGQYDLSGSLALSFNVGATSRRNVFTRQGVTSNNQIVFDVFRHFNFSEQSPIQNTSEQNIVGLFGQVEFDINGYLFVTLAARNDAVSNFAEENRSLTYPSISGAWVLSESFPQITNPGGLNFLKLRAGFGTSAGFRSGFPIASTLDVTARNFSDASGNITSANTSGLQLANPDLKPELQEEFEAGVEVRGWNNRITLEASWYRRASTDLIVVRPLDPSTGYSSTVTNIGEVVNKGMEIDLGVDILQRGNFTWNARANFTRARSEVTDLGQDIDQINIAGFSNLGNFAEKGEPLGIIKGSRISRSPDGEFLIDVNGNYIQENGTFKIGDPTPDFTLNVNNSLNYKNFNLNFVVNWVQGGDIHSATVSTLLGRGLTTDTEDRTQTFILAGVRNIGTADSPNYVKNDIQQNNSTFYFSNVLFGPEELNVFDATAVRLQEVSLSYSLPKAILENTPFGAVSLTASGFNLWYSAVNIPKGTNFDPNVAGLGVGNGQGFDYLNGPSSKRYGGTLKFTF